jgi:type IV secretion system protein VirB1
MTLHALAMSALIERCAPNLAPSTMTAIVQVESGGDPLAIGDNTEGRSYHPGDRADAEALARRLLQAGHLLDLGIAQIDSMNFRGFRVNVHTIFDPCMNLNIGSRILSDDYGFAARRYGDGQVALRHAIGMYNTGQLNAGTAYVRSVLAAAGSREKYDLKLHATIQAEARRAPVAIRPAERRKSSSNRRGAITPPNAPILIPVKRASGATALLGDPGVSAGSCTIFCAWH